MRRRSRFSTNPEVSKVRKSGPGARGSDLMMKIEAIVKENGWTQVEAAKRCGVTQPRINDLLRGRIARFSLDALVNIASALGRKVRVSIEDAA
jgi:predicted XRE-type DNA-binding protein